MSVHYRLATEADVPFINQVYNQSIPKRTITADLTPQTLEETAKSLANHNGQRPEWIIEKDGQRAGWVSLESFYGRPAYHQTVEISIYLDQCFQHQGLGKRTLHFIQEQAPGLGVHTVLAFIFTTNKPSLGLFKSAGFQRYGHLPNVADMDGKLVSLDILGKKF